MANWWLIFSVLAIFLECEAYKILVVFPMPSRSHGILGEGIVRLLATRGHEVTFITPFPTRNPPPNIREIDISSNMGLLPEMNITAILYQESDVTDVRKFFNTTINFNAEAVKHKNVQAMFNDPKVTFDVVVAEWMFTELVAGFAAVYNCPYIWLSSIEPHSYILSLVDEALNPSYNPSFIADYLPPFTFRQRLQELGFHIFSQVVKKFFFEPVEVEQYENLFGPIIRKKGRQVPSFLELKYNASLVLGNSHVSLGLPTRLPQNYKPVRGYHVNPDVTPLTQDLKQLLDNAKNGLIFFSMGSNLKSKHMPKEMKRDLLKVFSTLKQTVLWKFEEDLPNRPSNVHIVQWAPQQSILAHPNCILFITHGGGLSTTEGVYFGKPMIGIPVFGDQFTNIGMVVNLGMGLKVDFSLNMTKDLRVALEEILHNPSYVAKAQELSFVYHHRPVSPGAEVVHWVEHVVKTRGAPHLRSPALHVPCYQKYYLDLVAIIIAAYYTLKIISKRIFTKKKTVEKKQKKN